VSGDDGRGAEEAEDRCAAKVLHDGQFAGSICPDHMPRHPDDPGQLQAFSFGYGYLKALIQAVNAEV